MKLKTLYPAKDWERFRPAKFDMGPGNWISNWFSNMRISPFEVDGIVYMSVENFYQAMKTNDLKKREMIARVTPSVSKKKGRTLELREDWEDIKFEVMKTALRIKFSQPEWKKILLDTKDEVLIEWNNWRDEIWGVNSKTGWGQNLLGIALMQVREELGGSKSRY